MQYALVFLVLISVSLSGYAADKKTSVKNKPVIGVVHVNTATGDSYLEGVKSAISNYEKEHGDLVDFEPFPYTNNQSGLETMKDLIENKKIDILIGPTESDVYINAIGQRSELEKSQIPVISSLVTADVPHVQSGWFFLTNVDVRRRVSAVYDYLNKYWIRSIAVLYANTEFGQRAERAFASELSGNSRDTYFPLLYTLPASNARSQIKFILETRPEAIGIFGEREDLSTIYEMIRRMNSGPKPYKPIIFTIIDARQLMYQINDVHFVSVTKTNQEIDSTGRNFDDVSALSYDTTNMVLKILRKMKDKSLNIKTDSGKKYFRNQFEASIRSGIPLPDSKSGIRFSNYKNEAKTNIYHITDEEIKLVNIDKAIPVDEKIRKKLDLLMSRYNYWPVFNVVLLLMIIIVSSISDVKKWYTGGTFSLIFKSHFYLLLIVNGVLVLGIYIFMAETGAIRYDSVLTAIAFGVAPIALLRTTLFETSTGKSIGLGKLYDSFLQWINDHSMIARYSQTHLCINLMAYNNTVDGMRDYLRNIYREQPNPERRIKLETQLSELVNDSISYTERRKVCARLLLGLQKWEVLQECSMAPEGTLSYTKFQLFRMNLKHKWLRYRFHKLQQTKIEKADNWTDRDEKKLRLLARKLIKIKRDINREHLIDPEVIIRKVAKYCAKHDKAKKKLLDEIQQRLEKITNIEHKQSLINSRDKDLQGIVGEQARLRRLIAFLCIIRGYDQQYLESYLTIRD